RFEDILGVTTSSDEAIRVEVDVSNMETTISASPTPTLKIHKDHPKSQIIGPVDTPIQTRHKSKENLRRSLILCKTQAWWKLCKKSSFNSKSKKFEDILRVTTSSDEAIGVEADVSNIETTISASPTPTLRIHKDHPKSQIIGPMDTPIQTRHKSKEVKEQSFIATIYQKKDPALLQFCLFSCFLSQVEPKKVFDALQDPSWVEAMQEKLLEFKI
nr:hypothetical protein [Tanacetum cinerariifolium]